MSAVDNFPDSAASLHTDDQPDRPEQAAPHIVKFTVMEDGYFHMAVECPHDALGVDRPCSTWEERKVGEKCTCECDSCANDDHANCENDYIPELGTKWCDCTPIDVCWYRYMASEVGPEAFDFGRDGISYSVPVRFTGGSTEDPIEVEVAEVKP